MFNLFKKADKNIDINKKNDEAVSYFTEIEKIREFSKKIAWIYGGVATCVVVILAIAIMVMLPLKEVKPYLIKVETTTGYVETLSNVKSKDIKDIEALDKYFVIKYLQNREGYHYNTLKQEYKNVMLMSTPQVAEAYKQRFNSEKSPVKLLKDTAEINIRPISVQLQNTNDKNKRTAIIRFDTIQDATMSTKEYSEDEESIKEYNNVNRYIVTIEYGYNINKSTMDAEQRLYNPLGFVVSNYRLENEIIK